MPLVVTLKSMTFYEMWAYGNSMSMGIRARAACVPEPEMLPKLWYQNFSNDMNDTVRSDQVGIHHFHTIYCHFFVYALAA